MGEGTGWDGKRDTEERTEGGDGEKKRKGWDQMGIRKNKEREGNGEEVERRDEMGRGEGGEEKRRRGVITIKQQGLIKDAMD